jgi:hypothetical protein
MTVRSPRLWSAEASLYGFAPSFITIVISALSLSSSRYGQLGSASGGASSSRGMRPLGGRGAGRLGKSPVPGGAQIPGRTPAAAELGGRNGRRCAALRHRTRFVAGNGLLGQPLGSSLASASVMRGIRGVCPRRHECQSHYVVGRRASPRAAASGPLGGDTEEGERSTLLPWLRPGSGRRRRGHAARRCDGPPGLPASAPRRRVVSSVLPARL